MKRLWIVLLIFLFFGCDSGPPPEPKDEQGKKIDELGNLIEPEEGLVKLAHAASINSYTELTATGVDGNYPLLTDMVLVIDNPATPFTTKRCQLGNLFTVDGVGSDVTLTMKNDEDGYDFNLTVNGEIKAGLSTATPTLTLTGSDGANRTATINVESAGTAYDMILNIDIEENSDTAVTYIQLDGVNDTIEFKENAIAEAGFEIPNGGTPAVGTVGQIALDTDDDQLLVYGASSRVFTYKQRQCFTLEDPDAADDNVPIFSHEDGFTVTDMRCWTEGGTSVQITLSDGSNDLDTMTCDSDGANDDGSIAYATFTADEQMEFDTGTVTGSVDWVNFCFTYTITGE